MIPRWHWPPVLDTLRLYWQMRCQYTPPRLAGKTLRRNRMKWEKPAASDMRFGFEITMYIANR
jgi:pyrroloquinoline quinone biosynthesis protein A